MVALEARDLSFRYDSRVVLDRTSLLVNRGEVVSLLGPNGSGKTTLLKLLVGVKYPESGQILVEGAPAESWPVKVLARKIGYVPQLHQIFFPYRVLDVVLMGRVSQHSIFSSYSREDRQAAHRALGRLSIDHLENRPYTKISGGERQLVLIARALAQDTTILILDEPVTGLDYGNQLRFLHQIRELALQGYAILLSTHSPDHALLVSNRVYLLKDGKIQAEGSPQGVITSDNLEMLYQVNVQIVGGPHGRSLCVPLLAAGDHGRVGDQAPSLVAGSVEQHR